MADQGEVLRSHVLGSVLQAEPSFEILPEYGSAIHKGHHQIVRGSAAMNDPRLKGR